VTVTYPKLVIFLIDLTENNSISLDIYDVIHCFYDSVNFDDEFMQCTKQFSFDSSKCSAYVLPI
jgi:hypothetical protein